MTATAPATEPPRMRLSISVTDVAWPAGPAGIAGHLAELARAADQGGLDTLWVADHLLQIAPGTALDDPMLEAYTTLGFLAAHTERLRLGTLVTGVTYRPPALLIKAVTTLDVLTGGRAWLGIGAGYHLDEARAMGLPLPATAERFAHLTDTLQLAHQMWSGDPSAFSGTVHHAGNPISSPTPVTRPHPPILIGGTGEQRTLRLVARYGDACNLFDVPDGGATISHKLAVLAQHCHTEDRPLREISRTVSTRLHPGESTQAFIDRCARFADLGLDHVIVLTAGPWTPSGIDVLADARDGLADLTPAITNH